MRCGFTGKVIFKSHEQALNRGGEILTNKGNRRRTPQSFRAYRCEYCGFFHLASAKERDTMPA